MGRSNRYYGKRAAEDKPDYAKTTYDTKDVQKVKNRGYYYGKRAAKAKKAKNAKPGKKPQMQVRYPYWPQSPKICIKFNHST